MIRSVRQQWFRSLPSVLAASVLLAPARMFAQMPITGDYFAHDPSTMIKDGNRYYVFYTSERIRYKYSTDLRNWTHGGVVQPGTPPAWATTAVPNFDGNYWAPDVAYFNGKYHVYYSVSSWGTIDSAIGLATSPSLMAPTWTDQGKVVQSDAAGAAVPETDTTSFNCIDPSILMATNGTIWMVFGSYRMASSSRKLIPPAASALIPPPSVPRSPAAAFHFSATPPRGRTSISVAATTICF